MEDNKKLKFDVYAERAYIKLYKMKGHYNWEIKMYEDSKSPDMTLLKEKINKLNEELKDLFDMDV